MMTSLPQRFLYRAHGLTLSSELAFPDLASGSGDPDVHVRLGAVPANLDAPVRSGVLFEVSPQQYLLRIDGTARYLVRKGNEILIDVECAVDDPLLHTFFFGSVLTALLHQRGVLALHAGAVVGPRGAVLVAGGSGCGKSTLVAALAERGYEVLADEVAAVTFDADDRLVVHPGVQQVRLWRDAVSRLGLSQGSLTRVREGAEKYLLPLQSRFAAGPEPLAGLVVLGLGNEPEVKVELLRDSDSFATVRGQTRNLRVLEGLQMQAPHFRLAAAVASRVPVVRVTRPAGRDSLEELVARFQRFLD